ncbi:MAG: DUF4194 domain-containing protein [Xanthomonadales bacterium]|nr:DUF4194 domain-containing protein [Xanthomonadales bacterium]
MSDEATSIEATADEFSLVAVNLLKGVIYQDADVRLWGRLLALQARVRDYMAVLGLDLVLDEAEGYAFLRSREAGEDDTSPPIPRLVARRPLSFRVSLLLALLRRKLAEADAGGGDTRLILSREQVVDMLRVFLPEASNEARLMDQIDADLKKIIDLGFARRLQPAAGQARGAPAMIEVRRILKAFVDAQWLADFDARLADYQRHLASGGQDHD